MGALELYVEGMNIIGRLSGDASRNPMLMFDDEWREEYVGALVRLKVAGEIIRELEPPAGYRETHNHLLVAADHYDQTTTYLARGVDEMDPDLLELGIEEMGRGTEAVNRATEALP